MKAESRIFRFHPSAFILVFSRRHLDLFEQPEIRFSTTGSSSIRQLCIVNLQRHLLFERNIAAGERCQQNVVFACTTYWSMKKAKGYEVEFTTLDGETIAIVTLTAKQVRPSKPKEIAHARDLAANP